MQEKLKIAVIVGNFQRIDYYKDLYTELGYEYDNEFFLVTSEQVKNTNINPLDIKTRLIMIKDSFLIDMMDKNIKSIPNFKESDKWSLKLDETINELLLSNNYKFDEVNIDLFGIDDTELPNYSGIFGKIEFLSVAKEDLNNIKPINSSDFRRGAMYNTFNRYPITYPTVDIAIVNRNFQVLLGRKEFETQFRFIGGFVDPTDESLEEAAKREAREEVGNVANLSDFRYITSRKVRDWRYNPTTDGIMTSFFIAKYNGGEVIPSDDIFELKWINIYEFDTTNIVGEHIELFKALLNYLNK